MDAMIDVFSAILKLSFIGGAVFFVVSTLRAHKHNNAKQEILNLQALLSQYRLSLKSKVKKKANILRATFRVPPPQGDLVDVALHDMCNNPFERGADFQSYFDLSRRVIQYLQMDNGTEPEDMPDVQNDFMCSDFKTELDIARLIKDMYDLSEKINSKISEHNNGVRKASQKIPRVQALVFPSLIDVNRIFSSNSEEDVAA
ncbi:hypothetical protein [Pseudobdellovibrio exovorus]|uniref:Uncharacterized protein n=1 Tax=Pseudobdellovibrio exovorus JSS TaxID=1184267 RepID=M4VNE1_9BACT|nr:hypothetical protein [Pseudobdellovibrio exovorus]AGH94614.1 hypothetical protein A11Q_394 [Pseudobdellovibrio exovorus JSS]